MRVMIRCSPRPFAPTGRLWSRVALVLTFAAFGCVGQPADIAAPSSSAAVPRQSVSAGEGFVTCNVAVQISANTYRVKQAPIQLPTTVRCVEIGQVRFSGMAA